MTSRDPSAIDVISHVPIEMLSSATRAFPKMRFHHVAPDASVDETLRGEVLLTLPVGSPNLKELLSRGVRWVHTIGTGVDAFPLDAIEGQTLTCSRGASSAAISEWVLAVMLAFEKDLPEAWISAPVERWNWGELGTLAGKQLGLVGIGGIGAAIAAKALAFDMKVQAYRRSDAPSPVEGVEIERDLDALLASSDHLVIAASATGATRHLLDAERLQHAKTGLHLVNIARGTLVDQDALHSALDSERIARASLDVCTPEPLPEGHWLYSHPRVRLSPHLSWSAPDSLAKLFSTFSNNLERYVAGEALLGQVNLEQGY